MTRWWCRLVGHRLIEVGMLPARDGAGRPTTGPLVADCARCRARFVGLEIAAAGGLA
jgi:hypothetical protein